MKILKEKEYQSLLRENNKLSNLVNELKIEIVKLQTFRETNKAEIEKQQKFEENFQKLFRYNENIAVRGDENEK